MEKGIKQKHISKRLNISIVQVNRLLNEKANMSIGRYNQLEEILNEVN